MRSSFVLLSVIAILSGCSAASSDEPAASGDALTSGKTVLATDTSSFTTRDGSVTTITLERYRATQGTVCTVETDDIRVEASTPALTAQLDRSIHAHANASFAGSCDEGFRPQKLAITHELTFVDHGFLTIQSWRVNTDDVSTPRHQLETTNLDLESGSDFQLPSVIDEEGRNILAQTCKRMFAHGDAAHIEKACTRVVARDDPFNAFALTAKGIALYPYVRPENDPGGAKMRAGILVPWATVAGHVTHPKALALAAEASP